MMGARIAALRRQAGLSQAALASLLQCSPSAVGMYEQGRREPASDMLVRMARVFSVSTDYLLTGEPRQAADRQALSQVLQNALAGPGESFTRQELAVLVAALLLEP